MNIFIHWWLDGFHIHIYFRMKLSPYCMEHFKCSPRCNTIPIQSLYPNWISAWVRTIYYRPPSPKWLDLQTPCWHEHYILQTPFPTWLDLQTPCWHEHYILQTSFPTMTGPTDSLLTWALHTTDPLPQNDWTYRLPADISTTYYRPPSQQWLDLDSLLTWAHYWALILQVSYWLDLQTSTHISALLHTKSYRIPCLNGLPYLSNIYNVQTITLNAISIITPILFDVISYKYGCGPTDRHLID